MLWLYLSLLAAVFWSLVIIIDKHAITDEMRDPILAATISGFTLFLFFSLFSLFSDPLSLPLNIIAFSFLTGVCYITAIYFYYQTAKREEISRINSVVQCYPIVVLILSLLFLGELLSPVKYLGIVLLIAGAIIISIKKGTSIKRLTILLALSSMLFYALRSFFLEIATAFPLLQVLSWAGLGGLLVGAVLLAAHHPHIRKKSKKGIEHLILSNALAVIAFLLFTQAISLASASLVTAIISTDILFVFLIATALSKTHSHIIREELRGSTLLLKLIAIVLILLGLLLVV